MIEMELSDELVQIMEMSSGKQIPEDAKSVKPKFDDKGNLHLRCRNEDGKLVSDIGLGGRVYKHTYTDELKDEYRELKESNRRTSKIQNVIFIVTCLGLLVLTGLTMMLIQYMR